MELPNKKNFCGCNFADWLEVNLTDKCNGRCAWCIEKNGYHPEKKATVFEMVRAIKKTGKKNIILLGGDPTLYPHLKTLIRRLSGINIYLTTNGSRLSKSFAVCVLDGIKGINVSMHSNHPLENKNITGIDLDLVVLRNVFETKLDRALGFKGQNIKNERIVLQSQFSEQRQISEHDQGNQIKEGFFKRLLGRR